MDDLRVSRSVAAMHYMGPLLHPASILFYFILFYSIRRVRVELGCVLQGPLQGAGEAVGSEWPGLELRGGLHSAYSEPRGGLPGEPAFTTFLERVFSIYTYCAASSQWLYLPECT